MSSSDATPTATAAAAAAGGDAGSAAAVVASASATASASVSAAALATIVQPSFSLPTTLLAHVLRASPAWPIESPAPASASVSASASALAPAPAPAPSLLFVPRGIVNPANRCYLNSTMQALFATPAFARYLQSMLLVVDTLIAAADVAGDAGAAAKDTAAAAASDAAAKATPAAAPPATPPASAAATPSSPPAPFNFPAVPLGSHTRTLSGTELKALSLLAPVHADLLLLALQLFVFVAAAAAPTSSTPTLAQSTAPASVDSPAAVASAVDSNAPASLSADSSSIAATDDDSAPAATNEDTSVSSAPAVHEDVDVDNEAASLALIEELVADDVQEDAHASAATTRSRDGPSFRPVRSRRSRGKAAHTNSSFASFVSSASSASSPAKSSSAASFAAAAASAAGAAPIKTTANGKPATSIKTIAAAAPLSWTTPVPLVLATTAPSLLTTSASSRSPVQAPFAGVLSSSSTLRVGSQEDAHELLLHVFDQLDREWRVLQREYLSRTGELVVCPTARDMLRLIEVEQRMLSRLSAASAWSHPTWHQMYESTAAASSSASSSASSTTSSTDEPDRAGDGWMEVGKNSRKVVVVSSSTSTSTAPSSLPSADGAHMIALLPSPISQLVSFRVRSYISVASRSTSNVRVESHTCLPLDLVTYDTTSNLPIIVQTRSSLLHALSCFFAPVELSDYHAGGSTAGGAATAVRATQNFKLDATSLPHTLVVQLKRFAYVQQEAPSDGAGASASAAATSSSTTSMSTPTSSPIAPRIQIQKLTHPVAFDTTLSLDPALVHGDPSFLHLIRMPEDVREADVSSVQTYVDELSRARRGTLETVVSMLLPSSASTRLRYELTSVVAHHGQRAAGGHYSSYVRVVEPTSASGTCAIEAVRAHQSPPAVVEQVCEAWTSERAAEEQRAAEQRAAEQRAAREAQQRAEQAQAELQAKKNKSKQTKQEKEKQKEKEAKEKEQKQKQKSQQKSQQQPQHQSQQPSKGKPGGRVFMSTAEIEAKEAAEAAAEAETKEAAGGEAQGKKKNKKNKQQQQQQQDANGSAVQPPAAHPDASSPSSSQSPAAASDASSAGTAAAASDCSAAPPVASEATANAAAAAAAATSSSAGPTTTFRWYHVNDSRVTPVSIADVLALGTSSTTTLAAAASSSTRRSTKSTVAPAPTIVSPYLLFYTLVATP